MHCNIPALTNLQGYNPVGAMVYIAIVYMYILFFFLERELQEILINRICQTIAVLVGNCILVFSCALYLGNLFYWEYSLLISLFCANLHEKMHHYLIDSSVAWYHLRLCYIWY